MVDIKRRRVSEIVDRVVPTVRLDRQVVPVALNLRQRVGTWLVLPLHLLKRQRRLFSPTRRDLPGRIVNTRGQGSTLCTVGEQRGVCDSNYNALARGFPSWPQPSSSTNDNIVGT